MLKIATITCHDVYNYGASLQAYALQAYFETMGCGYRIIDYKPDYLSGHYRLTAVANPRFDKPLVRQLYLLAKLPGRLLGRSRKKRFDKFTANHLKLTQQRYDSCEAIAADCPKADMYIAGSDQIWNTLFRNGHDAAFYLDFVDSGARKISYAASFATDAIYGGAEEFVASKLSNFDAVSVRESSALALLEKLGRCDGLLVCDPVFLLSADEWRRMAEECNKRLRARRDENYILVYDCERNVKLRRIAEAVRLQTGLPIYTLSATYGHYADRDFSLSGPLEFLNLMAQARYVLADSFHALAFSLIFRKEFYIVNRTEGINARMRDFLGYLGLNARLVDSPSDVVLDRCVDFESVSEPLDVLVTSSKLFLNQQISLCR